MLLCCVVLAGLAASACGVDPDPEPRALPADLVGEAQLPSSAAPQANGGNKPASVFLVAGTSDLVPVPREVDSVSVAGITSATLADPTDGEVAAGITTAIPRDTEMVSGTVRADGVIAIDLSGSFAQADGAKRTTAIGQIVLGVGLQYDPERKFSFSIDGQRASVSTAEGARTIVTPCDFLDALVEPRELEPEVLAAADMETLSEAQAQLTASCPGAAT
ncbi:MAG: GerMN domain-containing protein [Microthrixaceae bacterium]